MTNFLELFRFVYKNLIEKKGRTFLTISGIIIGVFIFTFFIFISTGLKAAVYNQFSFSGFNVITVSSLEGSDDDGPTGEGLDDSDILKIKRYISNYNYISPSLFYSTVFEYKNEKENIFSLGYPKEDWDEVSKDFDFKIGEGRFLRENDKSKIVLGYKTAKTFNEENPLKVGQNLKTDGKSYKIVGILEERGDLFIDASLYINQEDLIELTGQEDYSSIRISYKEGADVMAQKEFLEEKLNRDENIYEFSTPNETIKQLNSILDVLLFVILAIAMISLLVGGINVMNTIYSNVMERLSQIATMKAIGATNLDIFKIFLIESFLLGFIGSLLGFLIAFTLAQILFYFIRTFFGYDLPLSFDYIFLTQTLLISSIFTMIFGTYPAVKAAKTNSSKNLNDD